MRSIDLRILLLTLSLIPISAFAQDDWQFVDETERRLPDITTLADRMDVGDVDGDGDLDMVVGCSEVAWPFTPGYEQIFINDGIGNFTQENSSRLPLINDGTRTILLFDIDNDLDLDLLVGSGAGDTNYIAINDGDGYFSMDLERMPVTFTNLCGADFGDVDNDGDIDLYVSYNFYPDLLLINDGYGYFTSEPERFPENNDGSTTVNMADLDGDMDLDIFHVGYPHGPRILMNDGTGNFADETVGRIDTGFAYYGYVKDVDHDDDLDIFTIPRGDCRIFINDGSGYFENESDQRIPQLPEYDAADVITFGDIDNDNNYDFAVGFSPSGRQYLLINDGQGYFDDQTNGRMPSYVLSTRDAVLADYDGDGDADYVRVGHGGYGVHIYINTLDIPDFLAPIFMNVDVSDEVRIEQGPYPLRCVIDDGVSLVSNQVQATLYYSLDSQYFTPIEMTYVGGFTFRGEIPGVDTGTTVYYYYHSVDNSGNQSTYPGSAPDSVFSFIYLPDYTGIDDSGVNFRSQLTISAYPNPFNSFTTITLSGTEGGDVRIRIIDITGRLVRTLFAKEGKAVWDALDNSGRNVSSGIYFARVRNGSVGTRAPQGKISRSFTLLR